MTQQVATDSIQVVTFSLVNQSNDKKEDYAIPIEQVKEIRTLEEITKVPKARSFVKGIMNLRGLIIPVLDVKDKLGFGSTNLSADSKQRILVAEVSETLYGLLVDDVDQVMRIPSKDIGPAPPGAFETFNYVKGIAKTEEKLIVLLDVAPLVDGADNDSEVSNNTDNSASETPSTEITLQPSASVPKIEEESNVQSTIQEEIPDELKAVFDEDEQGVTPTEIMREESEENNTNPDHPQDFQSQVDQETENM